MSFRAHIETVIFVDNFVNIDLFFQGYYFLKFKLYYQLEDQNLVSQENSLTLCRESTRCHSQTTYPMNWKNKLRLF